VDAADIRPPGAGLGSLAARAPVTYRGNASSRFRMADYANEMGVPPALPGRQSNFENSGSIPPAGAFVFAEARCLASLVPL